MCGIAGVIGQCTAGMLESMLKKQTYRGPDNLECWYDQSIALGHNRLSIIDLSATANQPMHTASGRYHIVFNGEVYNYIELKKQHLPGYNFHTSSDTEVLLALYEKMGDNMLPLLIGMFAFAIWDSQLQELFIARDRFGVKPFYYARTKNCWLFASEIKTLWQAGIAKEPNNEVWSDYLGKGHYGMPDQTFWKNIEVLPGGHCMRLKEGSAPIIRKWYHFEEAIANQHSDADENMIYEQYQQLMENAVKLRFRSDVTVGFNLSGGLDSSTLLGAVNHLFPNNNSIKGFSFYCNDERYDELPWVQQLIDTTGKPLEPVLLNVKEVPQLASDMAYQQDEPYGGIPTIAYGQVFRHARKQGVIVLLDGQGMDEAWGGYDYYYKPEGGIIQGTSHSPVASKSLAPEFALNQREQLFPRPFSNHLQNLQFRDLFYTKIPRALRFNDRASMMSSTELREPFLDHRLVEFAFALPQSFKEQGGITKYGLRKMNERRIGKQLALAPKRPLQTPQREWLRGPLKDWANDLIGWLAGQGNPGWFSKVEIEASWKYFLEEKTDNSFYVWQWINTALLLKNKH